MFSFEPTLSLIVSSKQVQKSFSLALDLLKDFLSAHRTPFACSLAAAVHTWTVLNTRVSNMLQAQPKAMSEGDCGRFDC